MTIEHRAVGLKTDLMGRLVNFNPLGRIGLVLTNLISDLRMEDFSSSARHASKPGFPQIAQDFLKALFGQKLKPVDLDGSPTLEMDLWKIRMKFLKDPSVPIVA